MRLQADDPFDVPRPDPAILVSAKPEAEQKLWIAGIGAGIAAGVAVLVALISAIDPLLPADVVSFVGNANAVLIGLFFAGLGVAHFAVKDAFTGVVPPLGTWGGLWQVPAPGAEELKLSYAEYHVAWTGVAEVGGGLLLGRLRTGRVPREGVAPHTHPAQAHVAGQVRRRVLQRAWLGVGVGVGVGVG